MTQKHWFIYRGDHHLGPFTFQEILDKVKLSEISDDELTWCEGNSDWLPAREQPAILDALNAENQNIKEQIKSEQAQLQALEAKKQEELIRQQAEQERIARLRLKEEELAKKRAAELAEAEAKAKANKEEEAKRLEAERLAEEPPPLPPLPPEAEEQVLLVDSDESEEPEEVIEEFYKEVIHPQEDLEEDLDEYVDEDEDEDENENREDEVTGEHEVLLENVALVEKEEESISGLRLYGSMLLSFIGLGLFVYLISQTFTEQRRLYNVAGRDKDALYNVMNRPYKGVPIHRMRTTKDLNSLWLATNFPDEAVLYMTMSSIPGRTLSQGEDSTFVEVQSVAQLRGGAALFEQLEVLKGNTLSVGEYRYSIRGARVGLKGKLSEALGDKTLFREMRFLRSKDQEFELKGTLLLSPYSEEEFESKLKDHIQYVEKSVVRPLKDRLQRYTTFLGLLERMDVHYKNIMKRITKGRSIQMFEDRYNEEVGPFLRDLIIDNNRLYLSLRNLQPKDSKAYEALMNYGKDIGIIASEMVTKTRRVKKLNKAKTGWLLNHFGERVEKLREQGKQEKNRIRNKLAPFVELNNKSKK